MADRRHGVCFGYIGTGYDAGVMLPKCARGVRSCACSACQGNQGFARRRVKAAAIPRELISGDGEGAPKVAAFRQEFGKAQSLFAEIGRLIAINIRNIFDIVKSIWRGRRLFRQSCCFGDSNACPACKDIVSLLVAHRSRAD